MAIVAGTYGAKAEGFRSTPELWAGVFVFCLTKMNPKRSKRTPGCGWPHKRGDVFGVVGSKTIAPAK